MGGSIVTGFFKLFVDFSKFCARLRSKGFIFKICCDRLEPRYPFGLPGFFLVFELLNLIVDIA